MTDKELIQAYHECEQYKRCKDCPNDAGETCIVSMVEFDDMFDRLEDLLADNAEMNIQIQKEFCKRVEVEIENAHLREVAKMVPQWHPASEPPEAEGLVLVTFTGKIQKKEYIGGYLLAEYAPGEGWILDEYPQLENPNVTHWCYLPEPPSTEGVE